MPAKRRAHFIWTGVLALKLNSVTLLILAGEQTLHEISKKLATAA